MPTIGYLLLPRPELEGIIHLVKNCNKPAFIWLKTQTNPILIYDQYGKLRNNNKLPGKAKLKSSKNG